MRPRLPSPARACVTGTGLVGVYAPHPRHELVFEGPRPGRGWDRHDWRPRALLAFRPGGLRRVVVHRRRWRLRGTATTQLDRSPDELEALHTPLVVVLLHLWSWLGSGDGLHAYDMPFPALDEGASRRTVHRWLHRLLPDAARLQGALRTAVIERSEPQPIERLFPGGLSPPGAVRCRRWKEPEAVYCIATALAFLVDGAMALDTSATVLVAEAQKALDGPLGTAAA